MEAQDCNCEQIPARISKFGFQVDRCSKRPSGFPEAVDHSRPLHYAVFFGEEQLQERLILEGLPICNYGNFKTEVVTMQHRYKAAGVNAAVTVGLFDDQFGLIDGSSSIKPNQPH